MISSGEKREEYREIKPYWDKRLNKEYDVVKFKNGYSKNAPELTIELLSIKKGLGSTKFGAPMFDNVYILKLGKVVSTNE